MNETSLENYQKHVSARLKELSRYLRCYAKGDFAESIPIPDEDDQFASLFAEVNKMIGSVEETIEEQEQAITERKRAEEALRKSEMNLAKAQRIAHLGNWDWDVKGNILTWSDEVYRIFGVDNDFELTFQGISEMIHPDDLEQNQAFIKQLFQEKDSTAIDFRIIRPDGEIVHIHQTAEVQRDDVGNPERIFGIMQDITEQKQAEEALRESEEKFRSLFNQSPLGIYIHDLEGQIINVNPTACKQLRYAEKELVKLSVFDLHPRSDDSINLPKDEILKLWKSWKPGDVHTISAEHQRKDGTIFLAEISTSVVQFGEKRVILALVRDITERKRVEEALEESNQRLFTVLNSIDAHIYAADMETYQILFMNAPMREDFGNDLVGKKCWEEFCGEASPCAHCSNDKLIDQDGNPTGVYVWEGQNPITKKWYLNHDRAVKWIDGRLVRLQIATDITERKRAEKALKASETKFREIFNSTSEAIVIHDAETGKMIDCNKMTLEMYGYDSKDEMLSGRIQSFSADRNGFGQKEIRDHISKAVEKGAHTFEWLAKKRNGEEFWVEVSLKSTNIRGEGKILAVARDITERKRAEQILKQHSEKLEEMVTERTQELRDAQEQLIRQEKLAALGKLAGSVSHELRNPLSVINNAVYYLNLRLTDADGDIKQSLEMIDEELQNATKIISDLLDFGRIKTSERTPVNLSKLIRTCLKRNPPPEHITIEVDIPENLPAAFVDGEQIIQVIDNLIANAYEAMPEGGQLSMSSKLHLENRIQIAVRDTGMGIPPENMEKIFEPLFTTKQRGIGLGLAISKSLVEANEGRIEVDSIINVGTTFRVFLPAVSGIGKR
jgi:PAS domain S-box-containing protein